MTPSRYFGGIEAGGTKFVCMIGSGPDDVRDQVRIQTATPDATLDRVIQFFKPHCAPGKIEAIGIGSFGPIDLDRESSTYGYVTSTPKPGWQNTDLVGPIRAALPVRIAFDTDVNAAALGEYTWGAGRGLDSVLYLTIGTGIGGCLLRDGKPLSGMHHPEMGHIGIPHDPQRDPFPGNCPFHGDCFEGLANGPALEKRLGQPAHQLRDDHPFWEIEAGYIAAALTTYILILSPRRIILGGGIMQRAFLFPRVRQLVLQALGGYIRSAFLLHQIDDYIVPPGLGSLSGAFGGLALAAALA